MHWIIALPKINFKKTLDCYKVKAGEIRLFEVRELMYLTIDGHGDPNTSGSWADAVSSRYPIAYGLKFISKNELDRDYVVIKLQALWWSKDWANFTSDQNISQRSWTAMIMVPEWTTPEMVSRTVEKAAARNDALDFPAVRLDTIAEGPAIQALHVGAYDDEGPLIEQMHHEFIPENALKMTGKHHEIYLSDARRAEPSRLRSILRQSVERI